MLVDLQIAEDLGEDDLIPIKEQFEKWVGTVLKGDNSDSELTIRIVSEAEMSELNETYRGKSGSTNVLSFPFEMPDFGFDEEHGCTNVAGTGMCKSDAEPGEIHIDEFAKMHRALLGDLVICAAVVSREASEQHKPLNAHWAHMTIHGVLHLLGHDHIEALDAEQMEILEITCLSALGYPTPY